MVDHIRAQLAAQGIAPPKAQKPPQVQRNRPAPAPTKDTKPPVASGVAAQIEEDATPPISASANHYHHPYHLQVANGAHFPGRMRCVLTGPVSGELINRLNSAIETFLTESKP